MKKIIIILGVACLALYGIVILVEEKSGGDSTFVQDENTTDVPQIQDKDESDVALIKDENATDIHIGHIKDPIQLKKRYMKACHGQSKQFAEAKREAVLKMCQCTVGKTDYKEFLENPAATHAKALDIAKKCEIENR